MSWKMWFIWCSSRLPTRKWTRHLRQRPRAAAADYRDIDSQAVSAAGAANPATVFNDRIDVICSLFTVIADAINGAF